jgi:hypothetical protein
MIGTAVVCKDDDGEVDDTRTRNKSHGLRTWSHFFGLATCPQLESFRTVF